MGVSSVSNGIAGTRAREFALPSGGTLSLLPFLLVVVGRIQEIIPALTPIRFGLITGAVASFAWVWAPEPLEEKIPWQVKQVKYLAVQLGLAVATIPIAIWPSYSFEELINDYWKVILLFLLVLFWCRALQDIRWVLSACCFGAIMLCASGLLTGVIDGRFNAESTTYDPNDLALLLVMTLPFLMYFFYTAGNLVRVLLVGTMVLCLYGIILTQSRGGFLALLVVTGFILSKSVLSWSTKSVIMVAGVLIFAALAGGGYWGRMGTMWTQETEYDQTAGARTEIWKTGIKIMATRPWGVGINGFNTAEGLSHGGAGKWSAAHNSFVQIGVELGVAGLIAFCMLLTRTIRELRAIQTKVRGLAPLASALEISLWGYIVGGFFLSHAYDPLLNVIVALSVACARIAQRRLSEAHKAEFS